MRESVYQGKLVKKLRNLFPGCVVIKLDPDYMQGVPDLLVLYSSNWAALEVKRSARSENQPNQEYYVDLLDSMSFAAFVYPENEEEVLHDLELAFQSQGHPRFSQP